MEEGGPTYGMHAQLESVAQRLERTTEQRAAPGRERPEEVFYLAKLSADAEREALNKLRTEVGGMLPRMLTAFPPPHAGPATVWLSRCSRMCKV